MTAVGRGVAVHLGRRADVSSGAAESFATACAAPSIQLRFDPNGLVTTCCKTLHPLGHIGRNRLRDIWDGEVRRRMVDALAADDFSVGCQRCGAEIVQEGRDASYAAIHDEWATHLTTDPASGAWPVRLEMNLSNSCNLQCIQCDGESSSSIRLHREGRPPLPTVYHDEFFEDLRAFLPHLDRIVFAGGEPFLGAENFRVWDMIAEEAPHIDCLVVTNATQWTPRIAALLERIRFSFVFSLDGITAPTYESIRIGADFERVMANVDRFRSYAATVGTNVSVNHCLMPQNAHEFGDLLLWAEERSLHVDVSVVRAPAHASIARLPPAEVRRIDALLAEREADVLPLLRLNRDTWLRERHRISSWVTDDVDARDSASRTVMWFRCAGAGPVDVAPTRAEQDAWAADGGGTVFAFEVGADDVVRSVDADLPDGPGLVGGHVQEVTKAVVARYGEMNDYEVQTTTDDRVEALAVFGSRPARIVTVAARDDSGWADTAWIVLAVR